MVRRVAERGIQPFLPPHPKAPSQGIGRQSEAVSLARWSAALYGQVNAAIQMEELLSELKVKIVELVNLVDVHPDDIDEDDQLVGGKLGMDSIDLLEMVMMLERDYGIKIDNKELGEKVFATLKTLAMHIEKNSPAVSR